MTGALDYLICTHFMAGYRWLSVIIHALICGVTVPAVMVVLNYKSEEGQYVYKLGMTYVNKLRKKLVK